MLKQFISFCEQVKHPRLDITCMQVYLNTIKSVNRISSNSQNDITYRSLYHLVDSN